MWGVEMHDKETFPTDQSSAVKTVLSHESDRFKDSAPITVFQNLSRRTLVDSCRVDQPNGLGGGAKTLSERTINSTLIVVVSVLRPPESQSQSSNTMKHGP